MPISLTAQTGRAIGSRPAGRLRREGKIPGVVYGLGAEAVAVSVEWTDLRRALTTDAGVNALIELDVDGSVDLALVKELQRDSLKRTVTHVDFLRVDPNAPIEVEVPLVLVGENEEFSREGGLVEQLMNRITVTATPTTIPPEIEVDISAIDFDNPVTVESLVLPEGVTTDVDPGEPIATGYLPRAQVSEEAEGEEGEGAEGAPAEGGTGDSGGESGGDADSGD
jgi:large subunit ribosomal protein L25